MEIKDLLKINIQSALKELGVSLELNDIIVEVSKDPTHGDYFFCEEYWINDLTNFTTYEV